MKILDVIHKSITLEPHERPVLASPLFQRLRWVKQMGFAELAFPGATHNRLIHSIGSCHLAGQAFEVIFGAAFGASDTTQALPFDRQKKTSFRALLRMAALLHDIGHGPLSHASETGMPALATLQLPAWVPGASDPVTQATHEDYTLKILLDSSLTPLIDHAGRAFGFSAHHVACLLNPQLPSQRKEGEAGMGSEDFFQSGGVSFRPLLQQIISSELDADRMDYLRRDSFHTGVSYGQFDLPWLLSHLTFYITGQHCYLALQDRALYAFEDFLLSRFHMFLMVYFHHTSVIYDEMLMQYFRQPQCSYQWPSDIEAYCLHTDAHLLQHLHQDPQPWAQRIAQQQPYPLLLEQHSAIEENAQQALPPPSPTHAAHPPSVGERLLQQLREQGIPALSVTSTSELSKYFKTAADPIFLKVDNLLQPPSFLPLNQCTDLFKKYEQNRQIQRIYGAKALPSATHQKL